MPVTVTVNVPRESPVCPWNCRVALALPFAGTFTEVGVKVSVTPVTGEADNVTVPANPFRLVTVIVVDPEPVLWIVTLVGFALMLKSPVGGVVTVNV